MRIGLNLEKRGKVQMIDRYYCFAGIGIQIRQDQEDVLNGFEEFETEAIRDPQIVFEMYQERKNYRQCYGIEYYTAQPDWPYLFCSKKDPKVRMTANRTWTRAIIEGCRSAGESVMEMLLAGFYSFFSLHGGILVHASSVRWQDEAIIFTAPSGTGKTTQAELWEKYKNAEILNGDKMLLDCAEGRCDAWGSPWRGSSNYALNEKASLRAVVVLEQAEKNSIRRLEGNDALAWFSPHLFYPSWNEECTKGVMDAFSNLMKRVPVYLLSCLPDREAVELTCNTIWGEESV